MIIVSVEQVQADITAGPLEQNRRTVSEIELESIYRRLPKPASSKPDRAGVKELHDYSGFLRVPEDPWQLGHGLYLS